MDSERLMVEAAQIVRAMVEASLVTNAADVLKLIGDVKNALSK